MDCRAEHHMLQVKDARRIRVAVSDCFESAATPGQTADERRRLLNFVIVGGGPTGIELGGELLDLIEQDLKKVFPREAAEARIVIVEAMGSILNTYDRCEAGCVAPALTVRRRIAQYTEQHMMRSGITLLTNCAVKEVKAEGVSVETKNTEIQELPSAITIWCVVANDAATSHLAPGRPASNRVQ